MKSPTRLLVAALSLGAGRGAHADARFENYDIRVIRPRYFTKTGRLELSAGLGAIVNQTFVASAVATGLVSWHFSETLAVEAQGGYAATWDREDKRLLDEQFDIKTIVLRTESLANGRLVWTPAYGKFHLGTSRIVYFDTFLHAGYGTTGVRFLYDHCDAPKEPRPAPRTVQYPTYVVGLGQRYFISKDASVRIGLDVQRLYARASDAACDGGESTGETAAVKNDSLFLYTTWSYYL